MFLIVLCLIVIFIILLCNYGKSPYQYYAKFTIYGLLFTIYSILVLPVFLFRPFNNKNVSDFWRLWTSASIPLGLKYRIKGIENIAEQKTVLLMFNHQSGLDVLTYARLLQYLQGCSPIAKRTIAYMGLWGLLTYLGDAILIDRTQGKQAMTIIRKRMDRMKSLKSKIMIFPEGTRNVSGTLLPFKAGGFRIAIENEIPIVPILISPYYFMDSDKKIFSSGRVIIQILPEISTSGLKENDLDALRNRTREIMNETFQELKKEIEIESTKMKNTWKNLFTYDF